MKQILIIGSVFLLLSCSLSKRKYMSGYHIDGHKSTLKTQNKAPKNKIQLHSKTWFEPERAEVFADVDNKLILSPIQKPKSLIQSEDSCDVLILLDGTEIRVKTLEVNESEIKYKACDYLNGPTRVLSKSNAFMIKFGNGTIQTFQTKVISSPQSKSKTSKKPAETNNGKVNAFALAALLTGIFGSFLIPIVGSITAIVLGVMALNEIKANPEQFSSSSKDIAIAGIVFGVFFTILMIGLIVLVLFM